MRKQQTLLHYALSCIDTKENKQETIPIRRALQAKPNVNINKTKTTKQNNQ